MIFKICQLLSVAYDEGGCFQLFVKNWGLWFEKNYIMRTAAVLFLLTLLSCKDPVDQQCVKGRYITNYCEGALIQVLNGNPVGRELKANFTKSGQRYVVASLDSLVFKGLPSSILTQGDSTFYFQYREGGYPQKSYVLCNPPPFITITALSESGCKGLSNLRIFS